MKIKPINYNNMGIFTKAKNYFLIFFTYIFIFIMLGCSIYKNNNTTIPKSTPNIVYILADDLGYGDLSFTGQEKFSTPNIDKLAKDGMFFTQHYSGCSVSAAARSSLITGMHMGHAFIRGNKEVSLEGQYPIPCSELTIAEVLKIKNYKTGIFGKWGLGYPGSEGDPNYQGFDMFYGYNCQRKAHNYYPYYLWDNQKKEMLLGNEGHKTGVYAPAIIHKKAIEFLEKNKDNRFFMYYSSIIPHGELAAPEEYLKKHRDNFKPEKPYKGTDSGKYYKNGAYSSQKEPHTAFAAMINLLDDQVGDIRKKLEDLGIADNTIIIFSSDHGSHKEGGADPDFFNSGGNFRGHKRDLYEGGVRVPMIAYWPGKIKPNTTSSHISAFYDVLPTFCDIADISKPKNTDGISFLPELLGEEQEKHKYLYWELHEMNGRQAVRMGKWKAVKVSSNNPKLSPMAIYDLSVDEGEQNNIADDNPEIVEQMKQIIKKEHVKSEIFPFSYEK